MCLRPIRFKYLVFLFIMMTVLNPILVGQQFGKNKVQYQDFKWNYLQSRHFDIYYYGEGKNLADFTADVAESSYVSLSRDLKYEIEKRIPILVYNSHNDFVQTNVLYELLEEGILGFTEIFKDRVVVSFRGSYKDYGNLVHHELTHAVMYQMMYGGRMGSMVTGLVAFQVPLWMSEGLAEFQSVGWDSDSDMFMRDATNSGYIPAVYQLNGYLAYKGGQSLLNFIADQYGREKIGEIFSNLRLQKNVEESLEKSLGMNEEDLTDKWHKYLRRIYWPDIQNRDEPEDISTRLTDHEKDRAGLNNAPSLSPKGDKLVFLSNRSDFIDLYLMNTIEKKIERRLIKGQRSELFEEVHWTRPGVGWSPDGERLVIAAKAGAQDALFILDVNTADVLNIYKLDLDGIFSPSWSPDGRSIVFMGTEKGQSDLFVYRIEKDTLEKLTDDPFSDMDPAWSPTGKEIVFVSDRGGYSGFTEDNFRIAGHDYESYDLFTIDVESRVVTRHTFDEYQEVSPAFSPDGNKIAFVSDRNGINNIYLLDRVAETVFPVTNLISGVSQISWSREGSRLAFSSFNNGGYDIYLLNNPLAIEPGSIIVEKTAYMKKKEAERKEWVRKNDTKPMLGETDYRNFVFDERFRLGQAALDAKKTFLDSTDYKEEGSYKSRRYKLRFTPDIVTGGAGYSQFFGIQGSSMFAFSDILGNHQINLYTDIFYNIKNSNFQLAYFYLPKRTDFGASIFHYSYLYYTYFFDGTGYYWGYYRDRNYGLTLYLSRPFDRYRRIEFGMTGFAIERDYGSIDPYLAYYYGYTELNDLGNLYKRRLLMLNLAYKTDTVLWGITGPMNGGRSNVSLTYSPSISEKYGLDFWTVRMDLRKYSKIKGDFTFVSRFAAGVSGGASPQRFLLGGIQGWFNYQYNQIPAEYWDSGDIFFFSSFETPLRGSLYYEMIGTRFFLTNLELRFPLIRYLILGWPLPFGFQNIRGALFLDIGSAWTDDKAWRPFKANQFGVPTLHDMRAGYGIGARLNMGFLLLKYDIAWGTDFESTSTPIHYVSLGAEF